MSTKYISWGQVTRVERERAERERAEKEALHTVSPVKSTTPVESSTPTESTSPIDSSGPVDSSSPTDSVIPIEVTRPLESIGPTESTAPAESSGPVRSTGPARSAGPVKSAQAKSTGPVNDRPAGRSTTGPIESAGPVKTSALRVERHYSRVLNSVLDGVLPTLPPAAALAYIQIYRLSYGNGRDWCKIGNPRLAERCGLGESTLRRAIRQLEQRDLIRIVQYTFGGAEQGTVYQVLPPPGTPEGAVSLPESDGPVKSSGPSRSSGPVDSGAMKDMKEKERKGGSSESTVYEIRTIAARIYEVHRNEADYGRDRLRSAVREALIGQGLGATDAQLEEAIRGMAH